MPTKFARDRVSEKSRADLLAEIADLPPSAFIPPHMLPLISVLLPG